MDTRDTPEQAELRRSARRLARELGPTTVADLDDTTRAKQLAAAVRDAGWLELRDDAGEGAPLAGAVEAAIVAEALGGRVADVAFAGPLLVAELARRAGVDARDGAAVAQSGELAAVPVVAGGRTIEALYVVDAGPEPVDTAYVLVGDAARPGVGQLACDGVDGAVGADLTRSVQTIPVGTPLRVLEGPGAPLTDADLVAWTALGLALTSADLVGAMRGVLEITVAYAADRRQFGVPVGSFQAVQHLLAEAQCLMEGSSSVAAHAAWAVDELEPTAARSAGRVAKAYCARAARTVCETAIQVHGGIGNTWECLAHVYLRRALLSTQWFGDDGAQLRELQRERLGVTDGLP